MEENSGKNKGIKNLKPFREGESGNPNGRPKGQKNYSTLYREALIKLAELNDSTPDELELDIIKKGLTSARKGDYRFYKDVLDRLHGQPTKKLEFDGNVNINGAKELASSLQSILDEDDSKTKESNKEDSGDILQGQER